MENIKNLMRLTVEKADFIFKALSSFCSKENTDYSLFYGKVGLSIYFYVWSRSGSENEKQKYIALADELLQDISNRIGDKIIEPSLPNGLSGIALGLQYLVDNKFVVGNSDEILVDIDDTIFRQIAHSTKLNISIENGILGYLIYLIFRSNRKYSKFNSANNEMFTQLIIKLINDLSTSIEDNEYAGSDPMGFNLFWELPMLLICLGTLKKLAIYNIKVDRILESISHNVLSLYPRMHYNRLHLLVGIDYVLREVAIPEWIEHSNLLRNGIDINRIINVEMKEKDIQVVNGIPGVYLLIRHYNDISFQNNPLPFSFSILVERILLSTFWDAVFSNKDVLLDYRSLNFNLIGIGIMLLDYIESNKKLVLENGDVYE